MAVEAGWKLRRLLSYKFSGAVCFDSMKNTRRTLSQELAVFDEVAAMADQLQNVKKRLRDLDEEHRAVKAKYEKQTAELKVELYKAELASAYNASEDEMFKLLKTAANRAFAIWKLTALDNPGASSVIYCRTLVKIIEDVEPENNRVKYILMFYRDLFTEPAGTQAQAQQLLLRIPETLVIS